MKLKGILTIVVLSFFTTINSQDLKTTSVTKADSFMVIIPDRTVDEIDADLSLRAAEETKLKKKISENQMIYDKAQNYVKLKETDIEALEVKLDQAEKDKKEDEVKKLESKIKSEEQLLNYLEEQAELFKIELEEVQSELKHAEAFSEMLEYEKDLVLKKSQLKEMKKNNATDEELKSVIKEVDELEIEFLESKIDTEELFEELSGHSYEAAKMMLELHKMQKAILKGKN